MVGGAYEWWVGLMSGGRGLWVVGVAYEWWVWLMSGGVAMSGGWGL